MSTVDFGSAPEEILVNILQRLRNDSRLGMSIVLPCLLVCQRWKRIGDPAAWKSLRITDDNINRFIASSILNRDRFKMTMHLTVHLFAPYPPICDIEVYGVCERVNYQDRHGPCGTGNCGRPYPKFSEFKRSFNLLTLIIEHGP